MMNIQAQNQKAVEAVYSATYVEDYMDAIETLPDDVQRQLSRMRELDIDSQNYMKDVKFYMEQLLELQKHKPQRYESEKQKEKIEKETGVLQTRIQRLLMNVQDIGDEKIQLAQNVQDYVENRVRQLEFDKKTLDAATRIERLEISAASSPRNDQPEPQQQRPVKRARRARLDPSISSTTEKEKVNLDFAQASIPQPKHTPSASTTTASQKKKDKEKEKLQKEKEREREREREEMEIETEIPIAAPTSSKRKHNTESDPTFTIEPEREQRKTETRTPKKGNKEKDKDPETKRQYNTSKSERKKSEANSSSTKESSSSTNASTSTGKKRKSRQVDDSPPMNLPIDPDEPTYCLCDQVSYGDMIGCDNDLCPIEWFHFNCVSLTSKPKGKWYCPKCRGDRPNLMKNKAIFLKELEEYNREKEEKA